MHVCPWHALAGERLEAWCCELPLTIGVALVLCCFSCGLYSAAQLAPLLCQA